MEDKKNKKDKKVITGMMVAEAVALIAFVAVLVYFGVTYFGSDLTLAEAFAETWGQMAGALVAVFMPLLIMHSKKNAAKKDDTKKD